MALKNIPKEIMDQLLKEEFVFLWSDPITYKESHIYLQQFSKFKDRFWSKKNFLELRYNGKNYGYATKKEIEINNIQGKKLLSQEEFKKFLELVEDCIERYDSFKEKIKSANFKKTNNKELAELYSQYCLFLAELLNIFAFSRTEYTKHIEEELLELLKFNKKDFIILTTHYGMDCIKQEKIDFFNLEENEQSILEHIDKHSWLFASTYSLAEAKNLIIERIKKEKLDISEIKAIEENIKINYNLIKETEKNYDDRAIYLASVLRKLTEDRLRIKSRWAGATFTSLDLLNEIANRIGISLQEFLWNYNINDTLNFLLRKKDDDNYAYILYNDEQYLLDHQQTEELYKKGIFAINKIKTNELRGQIASSGKALGKVIILNPDNVAKLEEKMQSFENGSILISPMTQPNMVPVMKKAIAIVTDEGGITSHAAVLSREFKIPCIVGTHHATRIFKDGDLVEVDAEKGIVRKLERTPQSPQHNIC